jgi:competence protein ComEA
LTFASASRACGHRALKDVDAKACTLNDFTEHRTMFRLRQRDCLVPGAPAAGIMSLRLVPHAIRAGCGAHCWLSGLKEVHMRQVSFVLGSFLVLLLALAAPIAAQDKPAAKAKTAAAPSSPVNLNTATVQQLEALPGVGTRTAQLIVEHRQKNGGFKKVEELMNIKGIGEKSFLKLKPLVTVTAEKSGS